MAELVRTVARGAEPLATSIIWFPTSIGRTEYVDVLARVAPGELWLAADVADSDIVTGASIADIARAHADRIAAAAPPEPWVLAGWALGAVVALEAARTLAARGHSIRRLLALESKVPEQPMWSQRPTDDDTLAKIYVQHRLGWRSHPVPAELPRAADDIAALLRDTGIEAQATAASVSRDLARFACHVRAVVRYEPQSFAGPIASLEVRGEGRDLGWSGVATRVQRYELDGDHMTVMSDAHAASTVLAVRRALDAS